MQQADEIALNAAVYAALGQSVTYTGDVAGEVSIRAVILDGDAAFPGGFESPGADTEAVARVQIGDIAEPRRGDTLATAYGIVYTVDSYRRQPGSLFEWEMRCRRG